VLEHARKILCEPSFHFFGIPAESIVLLATLDELLRLTVEDIDDHARKTIQFWGA
jgi:hypothetical protein